MPPCSRLWTSARHLELVLVDPEDRGDPIVRAARRRIRVPLGRRPARITDRVHALERRSDLQRAARRLELRAQPHFVRRSSAADEPEATATTTSAEPDAENRRSDHRPRRRGRGLARRLIARCFGALTRGLSAMSAGEGSSGPRFSPGCVRGCRPPTGLPCIGSMVIAALLIGLACGALAVLLAVRPALVERRRRVQEVIELERTLAAAEAELAVERGSRDERLEAAIKSLSTEALDANSARFLELAETHLSGQVRPLKDSLDADRSAAPERRARSAGGLRRAHGRRASASNRPGEAPHRDRQPRDGAARSARTRPLGRDPASARHRDGRDGRALRLRRAADDARTRRQRARPDVVVHLPGGKHVVIDSKVPARRLPRRVPRRRDDDERRAFLADHARHVREHVQKLSQKAYWRQLPETPELVVMFLPDETLHARGARARLVALRAGLGEQRHPRVADEPHRPLAGDALRLAAGDDRRERARGVASSAVSSTSAWRRWVRTSRSSDGRSTAQSRRTTTRSARSSDRCSSRHGASSSHGITGVEPPELQPIERQTRPLAAAELVEPASRRRSRPSLRVTTPREAGTSTVVDALRQMTPHVVGLRSVLRRFRERRS